MADWPADVGAPAVAAWPLAARVGLGDGGRGGGVTAAGPPDAGLDELVAGGVGGAAGLAGAPALPPGAFASVAGGLVGAAAEASCVAGAGALFDPMSPMRSAP